MVKKVIIIDLASIVPGNLVFDVVNIDTYSKVLNGITPKNVMNYIRNSTDSVEYADSTKLPINIAYFIKELALSDLNVVLVVRGLSIKSVNEYIGICKDGENALKDIIKKIYLVNPNLVKPNISKNVPEMMEKVEKDFQISKSKILTLSANTKYCRDLLSTGHAAVFAGSGINQNLYKKILNTIHLL